MTEEMKKISNTSIKEENKEPFCLENYCVSNEFNYKSKLRCGIKITPVIYKANYESTKGESSHEYDKASKVLDKMRKLTSSSEVNHHFSPEDSFDHKKVKSSTKINPLLDSVLFN